MRFRFIEDRRADYPVTILCDVLRVSPAGYYAWRARPESRRSAANRDLVDDIQRVHREAYGRYCAFHKNGTAVSLIDGQRFR
jgi:putative transposase